MRPPIRKALDQALIDFDASRRSVFDKEMTVLSSNGPFGQYTPEKTEFQLNDFDNSKLYRKMRKLAPGLVDLLLGIMEPSHNKTPKATVPTARLAMILAMLCQNQQRTKANNMQMLLTIHLHSMGVKSRQLDLLSYLGITMGYKTVLRTVQDLADQGK
jgi:hypothetical protein